MDIEHARTFIAVMETRNFVRAAEQLYVTQSTVSARIKNLEMQLGCALFNRSKAGVTLTSAGDQFSRHAMAFVRIWAQARQVAALPEKYVFRLDIGGQISHWDDLLVDWLCWLRDSHPDVAVRAEIGSNDSIMRQLVDGLLDLAIVYTPQVGTGLQVEELFEETLVLVSTRPRARTGKTAPVAAEDEYVFIDWGNEYRTRHALAWPDIETAGVHFGVGTVALQFILRHGGAGYFPSRMVDALILQGRLHNVAGAPKFHRSVFLVLPSGDPEPPLDAIIDGLRGIALDQAKR